MKNHYVLSLKLQAQSSLQKEYPSTINIPKDRPPSKSPIKIDEGCNSARNKGTTNSRPFVYEPVKSGSFVSSLLSPNSRSSNSGGLSLNNKPSFNIQKTQEKTNGDNLRGETQEVSKPIQTENSLLNNYREALKNKHYSRGNAGPLRDSLASPSAKNSFHEAMKNNSITANQYSLNMNLSGLAVEKNFSLEETSARKPRDLGDTSPQSKVMPEYLTKLDSKQNSKNDTFSFKGSVQASCSPKKSFLDNSKTKYAPVMTKKENLLSRLRQDNANLASMDAQYEERRLQYASPSSKQTYKKESFLRQQTSAYTNASTTLGVSSPASRIENLSSKGHSFLKDKTNSRIEEKLTPNQSIMKKDERVTDDLLNRYFKNKQRPDSSFDKYHVNSIRSMDFPNPAIAGDQKSTNSRILKSTQLDISDNEDRGKKENDGGAAVEDWNDKSKKNFLSFHKLFTENIKKVSINKDEGNNQLFSRLVNDIKASEEERQHGEFPRVLNNLEMSPTNQELTSLEALMTPMSANEKVAEDAPQTYADRDYVLETQQIPLKELAFKRYPNTTKHVESRRIDFDPSFEGRSTNEFGAKGLSNLYKSTDLESELHLNRSLTSANNDKQSNMVKKNKKSRTLLNDELEEKIAQLEKKRIDLYQGHQANDVLKHFYSKAAANKQTDSNVMSQLEDFEKLGASPAKILDRGAEKIEKTEKGETTLKLIYAKVKEGLEKTKAEKEAWMQEKKQLLEKIEELSKEVTDLRGRLAGSY